MKLNENSFRFLTNKELYLASDIAKQQYIKRACPEGIDPEQYVAHCWVEAIFGMMMKAGYKITIERGGNTNVYSIQNS